MLVAAAALLLASSRPDPLMSVWMQCLAEKAERFSKSTETADVAADAVMGACSDEEAAVGRRQMRGAYGATIAGVAEGQRDNRARVRQMVVSRIVELRTP